MATYPSTINTAMAEPKNSLKPRSSALSAGMIGKNIAIQSPDNAAPKPVTTRTRPAARCQSGRLRRKPGANWKAPSRLYIVTLTMCKITGTGASNGIVG